MIKLQTLFKYLTCQNFILYGGGSGGGGTPQPTTNTTNTSNIPPYAQPYVENMLGATQAQLFQTTPSGQTDPNTGQEIQNITGFQPYQAYGSVNPDGTPATATQAAQSAVAGFQPLQTQAQQGVAQLQTPEQYNQAMGITGMGIGQTGMYGQAGFNAGQSYGQQATDPNAVGAYMNPYIQNTLAPSMQLLNQQYGIQQAANQGRQTQAGAFGGSRGTLENSLNQQNQMLAQNQLVGNAYNQAYNTANQNMQQAASLGMQGAQAGLAGVGQQMSGASQLANLGQQQLGAQQNILNMQNQYGGQQQQYNQNVINQAMQNYANAQQYPIMELGTMSNMLRGLPMQATTTNQYQATPSLLSQGIGAAGVGATLSALTKKEGGILKSTTGINSYDVGGAIRADLENMPDDALQEELKSTQSNIVKGDIKEILAQRAMVPKSKSGGIMSYAVGDKVQPGSAEYLNAESSNAQAPAPSGITPATVTPAPAPTAPTPDADFAAWQQARNGIMQIPDAAVRDSFLAQHQMSKPETVEVIRDRLQKEHDKAMEGDTTRKDIMEEKANAKAEGERKRQLRIGQFFAAWGATPGPALVAGLTVFAKTVPNIIADSDKQAEIMNRIDHSIIELNRADRMERMGMDKEAAKIKQEQSKNMRDLNKEVVTYVDRQNDLASRERMNKETIQGHIAVVKAGLPSKAENDFNRKLSILQVANADLENVSKNVDAAKAKDKNYERASSLVATYEASPNSDPIMKSQYDKAKKYVTDKDKVWDSMITSAQTNRDTVRAALVQHGLNLPGTAATPAETKENPSNTGLPEGAKLVGTSGGKNVYELPNGKKIIEK